MGGHLFILHVYEPLTHAPAHSTAELLRTCQDARLEKASEKMQLLRDEFPDDPEVQAATLIAVPGFPDDQIRETAAQINADLIVASTHGYRGLNRLLLGSRAEQLIRKVPCPIMILPSAVEGSEDEEDVIELHRKPTRPLQNGRPLHEL
jgi:nucleotide-binding universal stress UspA family protein